MILRSTKLSSTAKTCGTLSPLSNPIDEAAKEEEEGGGGEAETAAILN